MSLFLPFLPLLPKQILLNNFLSDVPSMTIATDSVDRELVDRPRRWDIRFIRNFMLVFGLVSSVFDCLTFGALFGFVALPPGFVLLLLGITGAYLVASELVKGWFFRRFA